MYLIHSVHTTLISYKAPQMDRFVTVLAFPCCISLHPLEHTIQVHRALGVGFLPF